MIRMGYLLGVDQGASKTIAVLGDEQGTILGVGYSGGACHSSDGMATAMAKVKEACEQALTEARVRMDKVKLMVGGLTGADWDYEYELLHEALFQTLGISDIRVYNDCKIALRGGTDLPHGIVLCAGTAFNAAATGADGQEMIYGFYINDEDMGGTALGKAVIVALCNALFGIADPTALTAAVLKHYDLPSVDDLLYRRINRQLGLYKELAPLLFDTVKLGDAVAVQIVERFGKSVARYALAGLQRFGLTDVETDVVLSGSIFKAQDRTLQRIIAESIRDWAPKTRVVDALYEPVVGAFLSALDSWHGRPFPLKSDRLYQSAQRFNLIRLDLEERNDARVQ
ncbi:MAG: hypothetical protein K0Q59_5601 [Paenibacillus sp.]|nr:hypothetical protein [Paenibacillus sp.]